MEIHPDCVYRKSEQGVAEIKSRSRGLTMHARATLILVNGLASAATLLEKIGSDATSILQALAEQGYIELVPSKVTPVVMRPPSDAATPATPLISATPVLTEEEVAARLTGLRRAALSRLAPHFGPEVVIVAEPLLKARTLEAFGVALPGLEAKLHIYLGRKEAAALVATLRP